MLDLTEVNVILETSDGAKLVLPDDVDDCTEGWQFNEQDQIVLCSDTCDDVKSDITSGVRLLFGCVSGEVPEIQ
ncbi:MAG: hypothetical protein JW751_10980 [Polyangiaceae bacterium]|nr:hypothetical protein [Polyangiaceae bacterium]